MFRLSRLRCGLTSFMVLLALVLEPLASSRAELAPADAGPFNAIVPRQAEASVAAKIPPFTQYVASTVDRTRPARVLVVLHGMNGSGQDMLAPFVDDAERYGWVVVAPTFSYRDWTDPEQVRLDESEILPAIRALLEALPSQLQLQVSQRAIFFGFSRGAQIAQRFTFFYPESVRGVVTASAGTYTLPQMTYRSDQGDQPLLFPFGVSDLARYTGRPFNPEALRAIPFMVTVGAQDNRRADVPRQWDRFLGTTRIERAQAFVQSLTDLGVRAELRVVPQADHEVTSVMHRLGCEFLQSLNG